MNDALVVCRFQGLRHLLGDVERILDGEGAALESLRQRFALNEFHDQEV
jgi:hypothetical protein